MMCAGVGVGWGTFTFVGTCTMFVLPALVNGPAGFAVVLLSHCTSVRSIARILEVIARQLEVLHVCQKYCTSVRSIARQLESIAR